MKIDYPENGQRAALTTDLLVALAVLTFAILPLMASYVNEQKQTRVYSSRATVVEVVDGELELICAIGRYPADDVRAAYVPLSPGATSLPPGVFTIGRQAKTIRLTFTPSAHDKGGIVTKQFHLP